MLLLLTPRRFPCLQHPFAGRGPRAAGGPPDPHRGPGAAQGRESRLGRFQLSGRSNSAPGAYGWAKERQVSVDIPSGPALPAVREVSGKEAETATAAIPEGVAVQEPIREEAGDQLSAATS